ncbi:hypothetical protein [Geomonas subterranea]|uniref:hypothetical protein n=1 Tax=Geomonas subterranea TaxID=2847989 RepID=UPI001CD437B9|nr:hypothetical protein [Geomonas fuzhouensis]
MVRTVAGAVVGIILLAGSAYAADKPLTVPVVATVVGMGKTITKYCTLEDMVPFKGEMPVPVVDTTTCQMGSYTSPTKFYEVVLRGAVFYVVDSPEVIKIDPKEIQRLSEMPPEEKASYKDEMLAYTKMKWLESVKDAFLELDKTKHRGIAILDAGVYDMSEYTEGTGFKIRLYNSTKKAIKYVTVNFVGYNAVKDPVQDYRTNSKTLTLRGIGPIKPGEDATYSKDYAWMTDIVQSFKITGLKVEYMDGTKKVINDPAKVRLPRHLTSLLDDYYSGRYEEDEGDDSPDADEVVAAPAAE